MEEVCEVQSDKAAVEITSRYTGKIVKLYAKVGSPVLRVLDTIPFAFGALEGDSVKVGAPLVDIDSPEVEDSPSQSSETPPPPPPAEPKQDEAPPKQTQTSSSSNKSGEGLASPAVRRFAKEKGVDLSTVTGSGPRGAITKEDVLKHLSSGPSSPTSSMNESVKVPHMNIGDEYDVTRLGVIRQVLNKELADQDVKLSLTAFLIKAMSIAINDYPIVNSKFNATTQNSYTEYASHNVSVAIDSPGGLVVPCVKNVQDLTLVDIQRELVRLQGLVRKKCFHCSYEHQISNCCRAQKALHVSVPCDQAKNNRLSPSDLTGGTISLSNVGVISGTYIHPLLFDGQAVIVGVGRLKRQPCFVDRETEEGIQSTLEARDLINCSFSADHRHCDGATITRFSKRIKTLLENPELMLVYLK
ncbi:hypothetical protein Emag_001597 [Eimeria magna]